LDSLGLVGVGCQRFYDILVAESTPVPFVHKAERDGTVTLVGENEVLREME